MALRVWLPLNGDLENKGISGYSINIFRGNEIYNNEGKIGKCFYSNGVNTIKILNIIPDFYNYTSYSLCAWFYIESQNTSHTGSAIISGGNWNNQVLNLAVSDWSTDHYTKLRISGTNWNTTYSYNFNKNIWYHVIVSSDGDKTYAYVNGTLLGDTAAGFLPTSIEGNDICIGGATYYAGMQFFGRINDVRIYDHCLSTKEVKEISQGLVLHYKLNGLGGVGINLLEGNYEVTTTSSGNTAYGFLSLDQGLMPWDALPGKTLTFTYDYSVEGEKANNTGNWSKDRYGIHISYNYTNGSTTSTAYPEAGYLTVSGTGRAVQTFTIPSNITINSFDFGIQPFNKPAEGNSNIWYLKNVKLEVGDQDTGWIPYDSNANQISDSSGYNDVHASTYNIIFSSENGPRYNINADFYDNYSAIELHGRWSTVNGQWTQVWAPYIKSQTISFWWYSNNWQDYTSSEYSIPVCDSTNFSIDIANNNIQLNLFATTGYDTNSWNLVPLANLSTGWHYFTITYNNKQIIFYLDGIQTKTINVTANNVLDYFLIQNNLLIGNPQIM